MYRLCVCLFVCLLGASAKVRVTEGTKADANETETINVTYSYIDILRRWYGENTTDAAINVTTAKKPQNNNKKENGFAIKSHNEIGKVFTSFGHTYIFVDDEIKTESVTGLLHAPNAISDTEYLDFDDVLNNIDVDSKKINRKKPLLDVKLNETTSNFDYMNTEESNTSMNYFRNDTGPFLSFLNAIEDNEVADSAVRSVTETVIDLLNTASKGNEANYFSTNISDYTDIDSRFNNDNLSVLNISDNDEEFIVSAVNVMKREISSGDERNATNVEISTATSHISNVTETFEEIKENVLNPLNHIIKEKQEEVDELLIIKEKILGFMNTYKDKDFILTSDINKMMEILALIDFTRSSSDAKAVEDTGENFESNGGVNLNILDNKVENFNRCVQKVEQNINVSENEISKNESTFKQIINVLRNTKKVIMKILRRKAAESQRVKELKRKNEDKTDRKNMLKFEEVMQRWQQNLNVVPFRHKRSLKSFKETKHRIMNILPKYLRRKVNPAVDNKKPNKKSKRIETSKTSNVDNNRKKPTLNNKSYHLKRDKKHGIKNKDKKTLR